MHERIHGDHASRRSAFAHRGAGNGRVLERGSSVPGSPREGRRRRGSYRRRHRAGRRDRRAADEVFWTERGFGPRVAARDGGAVKNLRVAPPPNGSTQSENIYVTNDSLYFTEPARGTVWQCARTGCPDGGGAPIYSGPGTPLGITADDGSIYWADEGSPDGGGFIYRLAK